jgi:DNA-directed RNA polymerase subunit omega
MNSDLVEAASRIIPNHSILINMVSRRVRQLSLGRRLLVEVAPGLRAADIALTEITNGKLTFELTFGEKQAEARMVGLPNFVSGKKRAA